MPQSLRNDAAKYSLNRQIAEDLKPVLYLHTYVFKSSQIT